MLRDIAYGLPGDVRRLPSDDADLLERRPRRSTDQERDVIDVPGGAVGHRRDETLPGTQPGRHEPRELPIIVSRDLAHGRAADIMQGVVGKQGQGLTLGVDHGEDADVGVGRAGRPVQHIRRGAGVHLHLVIFAEGIGRHLAGLEVPAPVEDLVGQGPRGGADRRGTQGSVRPDDGLRDSLQHHQPIGGRLGVPVRELGVRGGRLVRRVHAGMGMGAADQHVLHRDTGGLGGQLLGFGDDFPGNAEVIDHDPGELRLTVVHDQGPGIERIMGRGRRTGTETSGHVHRELLRRDIHRRRSGLQGSRRKLGDHGNDQ